jgi:hypothetical protein
VLLKGSAKITLGFFSPKSSEKKIENFSCWLFGDQLLLQQDLHKETGTHSETLTSTSISCCTGSITLPFLFAFQEFSRLQRIFEWVVKADPTHSIPSTSAS